MRIFSRILISASTLVLASSLVSAAPPNRQYAQTCREIERRVSSASAVAYPGSDQYAQDILHPYASSTQESACTVQPGTPEDAALILTIVGKNKTPYGVKSGGHTTNPGWSSSPGVLIVTSRFNGVSYDPATNIASVGPGQTGEQVYQKLEPYNVSAALGRVKGVGVGGFTLGGGYSWMTNLVGLSCDTVVAFEVALPTGKVVTATSKKNEDLFFALKGAGGNNLGVVTRIDYTAIPQPAVWGGLNVYLESSLDQLAEAVAHFEDTNNDNNAVIGVTFAYDPSQGGLFASVFFYYHGPSPPSGTFDAVLAVPAASSTLMTTSLTNLVSAFVVNPPVRPRTLWRSVSIADYSVPLIKTIAAQVKLHGPEAFQRSATQFTMAVEPFTQDIFNHQPNGPAAFYHQPGTFFAPSVVNLYWTDESQDEWFHNTLKEINANVTNFAASEAGGFQPVLPPNVTLYPNYAAYDTPTSLLFGPNIQRLKEIQAKYDPRGVTKLTSGWKF
ncbi:hypothetical protein VNI00_012658 [Paramarasmius palmivorus]|uniref:FAD-binding PCMH-type domain-containing protein n=1 Tax=Paramarasmius palmivorus TaxID=297713 RepID=A0AAW0C3G1_9AGAR